MSGPITHKATMEKMIGVSRVHMPVFWTVGGYLDNIEADTNNNLTSHGADLTKSPKDYGLLFTHVIPTMELIKSKLEEEESDGVLIRRLCHYCEDSLTVGQICGLEFWGSIDDRVDIASELVSGKKNLHNNDISFSSSFDNLVERHKSIMNIVYSRYYKDAKKWGRIITPREVTNMTRVAVVNGANLAASWLFYAWNEAGCPEIQKNFIFRDFRNKFFDRKPKKGSVV
jgi:hypothetical protein